VQFCIPIAAVANFKPLCTQLKKHRGNLMDFTDKRVLVTGASRGIGFEIATAFLTAGARVAINGSTEQTVGKAMERLGNSERTVAAPGNIGTVAGCELAVSTAVQAFGGLDVLVNNAGVGAGRPIEECDEAMYDAHADVNLKGLFFCCRAALPELRKSRGNIVNIGSDAGLMGVPGITVYCGTKGGVVNMTRAMALEIAPDVRVNCICPGYVDTDMIRISIAKRPDPAAAEQKMIDYAPLKRIASTQEIAHAVLYMASHEARFITGASLPIDGGASAGR
jgi:NAD(P)-dependent dehydrogenase (short-subunit alcohol dehydrogenase family)